MAGDETFLDLGVNLNDVPDATTVPGGEYQVTIADLGVTETEKGKFLIPKLEIDGHPTAKIVSSPLRVPTDGMDPKRKISCERQHKYFRRCFGLPMTGPLNFNDQIGKKGWVTLDEEDDPKYGKQNNVRQWLQKR